jgi:hypothetical protein
MWNALLFSTLWSPFVYTFQMLLYDATRVIPMPDEPMEEELEAVESK